jgi:hypothetical protein
MQMFVQPTACDITRGFGPERNRFLSSFLQVKKKINLAWLRARANNIINTNTEKGLSAK